VQQEIVEEAARQKASHMRPVPDDSRRNIKGRRGAAGWGGNDSVGRCGEANWLRGSRGYGPKLRLLQSFDLPSALVRLPRWHSWLKRLRDEVVAWQLEQRKLQKAAQQGQEKQQPQQEGQEKQQPQQEGQQKQQPQQEAPSASKRPLVASFTLNATTPDGLPMRQEIRITVDPPGARQLLSLVRRAQQRGASCLHAPPGAPLSAALPLSRAAEHSVVCAGCAAAVCADGSV
jgi:Sec-independent protein translocase protein TatA